MASPNSTENLVVFEISNAVTKFRDTPNVENELQRKVPKLGNEMQSNDLDDAAISDQNGNNRQHPSTRFLQFFGLPVFNENEFSPTNAIQPEQYTIWNGLYAILSMVIGVVYTFIIMMIPYHNQVEGSNFWYDHAMLIAIFPLMFTIDAILQCYYCFKAEHMISLSTLLRIFIPSALLGLIPYCAAVLIWTTYLGYNLPIPFTAIVVNLGVVTFTIMLWKEISSYNMKSGDRKRIIWFLLSLVFLALVTAPSYAGGMQIMLSELPSDFQWLMALILPIIRHLNWKGGEKIILRAKPDHMRMMQFQLHMGIQCNHEFFVALSLTDLQSSTVYAILGAEFILHLFSCYQIISLFKKVGQASSFSFEEREKKTEMETMLSELTCDDTILVSVPVCYLATFISAYYGPNASILGNIGNSYWNFVEIDNVRDVISSTMLMAGIDFGILLTTWLTLWVFCKIDVLKEFCRLMKTCWSWIGIRIALILFPVIKSTFLIV